MGLVVSQVSSCWYRATSYKQTDRRTTKRNKYRMKKLPRIRCVFVLKIKLFCFVFLRFCGQILVDRQNWIEKSPPLVAATCLLQFQGHTLHWNSRWLIESKHWHFNDMKWVYILHECHECNEHQSDEAQSCSKLLLSCLENLECTDWITIFRSRNSSKYD